jgi:hypothetical protein
MTENTPEQFVSIQLSPIELDLLFDLLNVEVVYQLKNVLTTYTDPDIQLKHIIDVFEVYKAFETKIFKLKADILEVDKQREEEGSGGYTLVIINRLLLAAFESFAMKTSLLLPPQLKERFDVYGPALTTRLTAALASPSRDLSEFDIKDKPEGKPEETSSNVPAINMLGIKGLA